MKIRSATAHDTDAMVGLVIAMLQDMASYSALELNEAALIKAQLRERFTGSLDEDDHVCFVASIEGISDRLGGVVEASVASPPSVFRPRAIVHVHSLYVQPQYRGQGLGRQLLEEALAWGRAKGCVEAELSVLAGNPARGLYERLGFEVFELEMQLRL